MNKKNKKVCTTLNCIEHLIILAIAVFRCVSISASASFVGIPIEIKSLAAASNICEITAGIKKYKSIIQKKKKKRDEIVLLPETKLNKIEVVISRGLID